MSKEVKTPSTSVESKSTEAMRAERDYLWRALAELEVYVKTAPPDIARFTKRIEAALDGFKPALQVTRVDAPVRE